MKRPDAGCVCVGVNRDQKRRSLSALPASRHESRECSNERKGRASTRRWQPFNTAPTTDARCAKDAAAGHNGPIADSNHEICLGRLSQVRLPRQRREWSSTGQHWQRSLPEADERLEECGMRWWTARDTSIEHPHPFIPGDVATTRGCTTFANSKRR